MSEPLRNWAGNVAFAAATLRTPQSLAELQEVVRAARKVRALGSRHSFNRIADSDGELVSLRALNHVTAIDPAARTVTVEGGIVYGELGPALDAAGYALKNLASLPHVTIAGAVATATHGSGNANGNLAASVAALTLVGANGELVTLSRGDADFDGAVVGLGALGVVASLSLDIVPRFMVREVRYQDLPFATLVDNIEAVMAGAYSVSIFTHWRGDTVARIWYKGLADAPEAPETLFGAPRGDRPWELIELDKPGEPPLQMGVPAPWHLQLPHFRMESRPSSGHEVQTEYFVARADAAAALGALKAIEADIAPLLIVSEIRSVAADDLWLSGSYSRDTLGLHFTWRPDEPEVRKLLPRVEAALRPFAPRPHWGKLFTMDKAEIATRFPRLGDFRALARRYDPQGKFRNTFLDETLF